MFVFDSRFKQDGIFTALLMACNFNQTAIVHTILEMSDDVDVDAYFKVSHFMNKTKLLICFLFLYVRDH